MFDHIFKPLSLRDLILPNRICLLAHRTNFARNGRLNDRHIAYYRRRAQGECGCIIVGELAVHPDDRPWETLIEVHRPEVVADFQKLTDTVHQFDTRIIAQLNHYGFQSSGYVTRKAILGPSAVADIVFGETCKPMEPEDMTQSRMLTARPPSGSSRADSTASKSTWDRNRCCASFYHPSAIIAAMNMAAAWRTGCVFL